MVSMVSDFWGDLPTWVAGVATTIAVVLALIESTSERRRRVRQERRAQAEVVSAWFDEGNDEMVLQNASDQPVYEAVVSLVLIQGAGPRTGEDLRESLSEYQKVLAVVPTGRWALRAPEGWAGMSRRPGIEVGFTDHTGQVNWIRRATGALEEIRASAVDHYGMSRPLGFQPLDPR